VNGIAVLPNLPQPLLDGDIIRMGQSFLVLRHEPAVTVDAPICGLLGISPAMRAVRHRIQRLAQEPEPVLIQGETGTGKERVARALHDLAERYSQGDFVAINCSTIPRELAESELFGHERNAFTGAAERLGCFRRANRGTLLLDEVGEMPLEIQPKLLRALQERIIKPVGADRELRCDLRVLAATHRELHAAVVAGEFRRDLFERLARFTIMIPPLRERREDILLFLDKQQTGRQALEPEVIEALLLYDWPGNVREVQSVAAELRIDGPSEALFARLQRRQETRPSDPEIQEEAPRARPYRLQVPEKEALAELFARHRGNVSRLASELGCSRRQARRWLDHHGLASVK
jgi:transcriptional regulator with PAS, ATPase and Fis domain